MTLCFKKWTETNKYKSMQNTLFFLIFKYIFTEYLQTEYESFPYDLYLHFTYVSIFITFALTFSVSCSLVLHLMIYVLKWNALYGHKVKVKVKVKVKSLIRVWHFVTPWTTLPGFSVHGIFQARVLEWVTISFFRRCSRPGDWTPVSRIVGRHFTLWATRMVSMLLSNQKINISMK